MQAATGEKIVYDLSMFDERVDRRPVAKAAKPKAGYNPVNLTRVVAFVIIIATLAAILLSYAQLNEISNEVTRVRAQLTELKEEEKRMTVLLDEKTSLKKVDEYARNVLGMTDVASSQLEYISINNEDKVAVFKTAPAINLAAITDSVVKSFNAVMEYLR